MGHKGIRNGQGRIIWPSGSRYAGTFESDRSHGPGLYMWPDGTSWEGAFSQGLQDGAGILRGPPKTGGTVPAFEEVMVYSKGESVAKDPYNGEQESIGNTAKPLKGNNK